MTSRKTYKMRLVPSFYGRSARRNAIFAIYSGLSLFYDRLGRTGPEEYERCILKVIEKTKRLAVHNPEQYEYKLVNCYCNLACALCGEERFADKEKYYFLTIETFKRIMQRRNNHESQMGFLFIIYSNLGSFYLDEGHYDEAEKVFLKLINDRCGKNAWWECFRLAETYYETERFEDADKYYHMALERHRAVESAFPDIEMCNELYADVCAATGRSDIRISAYSEARELLTEVRNIYAKLGYCESKNKEVCELLEQLCD